MLALRRLLQAGLAAFPRWNILAERASEAPVRPSAPRVAQDEPVDVFFEDLSVFDPDLDRTEARFQPLPRQQRDALLGPDDGEVLVFAAFNRSWSTPKSLSLVVPLQDGLREDLVPFEPVKEGVATTLRPYPGRLWSAKVDRGILRPFVQAPANLADELPSVRLRARFDGPPVELLSDRAPEDSEEESAAWRVRLLVDNVIHPESLDDAIRYQTNAFLGDLRRAVRAVERRPENEYRKACRAFLALDVISLAAVDPASESSMAEFRDAVEQLAEDHKHHAAGPLFTQLSQFLSEHTGVMKTAQDSANRFDGRLRMREDGDVLGNASPDLVEACRQLEEPLQAWFDQWFGEDLGLLARGIAGTLICPALLSFADARLKLTGSELGTPGKKDFAYNLRPDGYFFCFFTELALLLQREHASEGSDESRAVADGWRRFGVLCLAGEIVFALRYAPDGVLPAPYRSYRVPNQKAGLDVGTLRQLVALAEEWIGDATKLERLHSEFVRHVFSDAS